MNPSDTPKVTAYVVGDLHLTQINEDVNRAARLNLIRAILDAADADECPVVFLGDVHDTKDRLTPEGHACLDELRAMLDTQGHPSLIIQGNHDVAPRNQTDHMRVIFDGHAPGKTRYIAEACYSRAINAYLCPWSAGGPALPVESHDIVLGHFDVADFRNDNDTPTAGIDPANLREHGAVILGHLHGFQQRGNITYLGAPYDIHFGSLRQRYYAVLLDRHPWFELRELPLLGPTSMVETDDPELALKVVEAGGLVRMTETAAKATKKWPSARQERVVRKADPPVVIKRDPRLGNINTTTPLFELAETYLRGHLPDELDSDDMLDLLREIEKRTDAKDDRYEGVVSFKSVQLTNFMAYADASLVFPSGALVLVDGRVAGTYSSSVGAGKSTLIEAVRWALAGDLLRDGVPVAEIKHRRAKGSDPCSVLLGIDAARSGMSILRARDHDAVGKSGVLVDGKFSDDAEIVRLTGMCDEVFMSSVCFGRATKSFVTAASDVDRKRILAELTGAARRFDSRHATAKRMVWEATQKLDAAKTAVQRAEAVKVERQAQLDMEQQRQQEWDRRAAMLRDAATEDVRALEVAAQEADDKAKKAGVACSTALHTAARLRDELAACRAKLPPRMAVRPETCPTCGQAWPTGTPQPEPDPALIDRINDLDAGLKMADHAVREAEATARAAGAEAASTAANLRNARARQDEARRANTSPYDVRGRQRALVAASKALREATEEVDQSIVDLEYATFAAQLYGPHGLPVHLLDVYLPRINEEMASMLAFVTDGAISVSLDTETGKGKTRKEKISLLVDNRRGGKSFGSNSDGEQHLVSMALMLALHATCRRSDLLFIDEMFDNLDSKVGARLHEYCEEFARRTGTCILATTHKEDMKALFSRIIFVDNDGTTAKLSTT